MNEIAYSTLACPGWTLEQAVAAAKAFGYRGLELRLVDGELIEADMAPAARERVAGLLAGAGLGLAGVDSSIRLTAERPVGEIVDELRGFLDLARGWSSPLVRVFGGTGDPGQAGEVLRLAAPDAERLGVAIGLETHDSFSSAAAVAGVLQDVSSPAVGVVWDLLHTHRMGESPEDVVRLVGSRIVDVHVKDARRAADGEGWDLVLLGEGEVPVRRCVEAVRAAGYVGWLVVEWEKRWHPEIEEPEVALPRHLEVLGGMLDGAG